MHYMNLKWRRETREVYTSAFGMRRRNVHDNVHHTTTDCCSNGKIFSLQVACCKFFGVIKVKYLPNKFWYAIRETGARALACVCVYYVCTVFIFVYLLLLLFLSVCREFIAYAWRFLSHSLPFMVELVDEIRSRCVSLESKANATSVCCINPNNNNSIQQQHRKAPALKFTGYSCTVRNIRVHIISIGIPFCFNYNTHVYGGGRDSLFGFNSFSFIWREDEKQSKPIKACSHTLAARMCQNFMWKINELFNISWLSCDCQSVVRLTLHHK